MSDGFSGYSYDHANRLIGVVQSSDASVYGYNGLGDRLQFNLNGVSTAYTLDVNRSLSQVLFDGENRYLYGSMRIGKDQSGIWQYYAPDTLGSVRQLTNSLSTLMSTTSYEAYGSEQFVIGSETPKYGFAGEWKDDTGLIHLRARYYDPNTSRFIQEDPWGGKMLMPQTINPYAYSLNNPLLYVDPSGECPVCWIALILGLALSGCSTEEQVSPETILQSSMELEVYNEHGGVHSIGTYLGDGQFITHDHFDDLGLNRIDLNVGVMFYDAYGQEIGYVSSDQVDRIEAVYHSHGIYRVEGGLLESSNLVPSLIGPGDRARKNRIGIGVRWVGNLAFRGNSLEAFEARIIDKWGQIENLPPSILVGARTDRGASGAGFWLDSKLIGVLRGGAEDTTYHIIRP